MSLLAATLALGAETLAPVDVSPREFRAMWVATVANIDWPSHPGLPVAQLRAEADRLLDIADSCNLNAIVLQVRPAADALYASKLEPWSAFLTGEQGKAPEGGWDPLAYWVEGAHRRGMELHAWFNPYRAKHPAMKGELHSSHISLTHPNSTYTYGTFLWMDPAQEFVQKRTYGVMMDVVRRYDVDGIHIDDYFYPYPVQKDGQPVPFPDQATYATYQAGGGAFSRDDWRRDSVNRLVKAIYTGAHAGKHWVKFGISPFGIDRPGKPEGIRAGIDQYAELYADVNLWWREGWCDYLTPQLYWPIWQQPQAYSRLLDYWIDQNAKGRHLWPGSFTSRTNPKEGDWPAQEVVDQIALTRARGSAAPGQVHFSAKALAENWNGLVPALRTAYAAKALPPASPWLSKDVPPAPVVGPDGTLRVEGRMQTPLRWFAVYRVWQSAALPDRHELIDVLPAKTGPVRATPGLVVSAVNAAGVEGPRVSLSVTEP